MKVNNELLKAASFNPTKKATSYQFLICVIKLIKMKLLYLYIKEI